MTPTVLHLFSGSGGCTLGFARAGFASLGSVDFDASACRDLERLTGTELWELTGGVCPDVVVMSPPCKSFSGCMPAAKASDDQHDAEVQRAAEAVAAVHRARGGRGPQRFTAEAVRRWRALFQAAGTTPTRSLAGLVGCNASTVVEARRRVERASGVGDERVRVVTRSRR